MNKAFILVIIAEIWMTIGQIFLKKGANHLIGDTQHIRNSELNSGYVECPQLKLLKFPIVWLGGVAMLVGLVFWLAALNSGQLSYVYLLGSIQYIFALIAAHFFLHEKIDTPKLIGTMLIMLGIILTAIS